MNKPKLKPLVINKSCPSISFPQRTTNFSSLTFAVVIIVLFAGNFSFANNILPNDKTPLVPTYVLNTHGNIAEFLASFSGKVSGCEIVLNWDTRSEIGNDHFEIQRSSDGLRFFTIGRVNGAGNSISPQHYQYFDENIFKTDYFYRLKLVDFNGEYLYSEIIQMETTCKREGISIDRIFDNPNASNWMNIKVFTEEDMDKAVLVIKDNAQRQLVQMAVEMKPVSYTHLTLPTKRIV